MNNLPKIQVISASESDSSSSSSVDEDEFQADPTDIDKIDLIHKDLQRRLTYQIMQYKNTSRQVLSEIPIPTLVNNESPSSVSIDNFESKPPNIQNFAEIISNFQSSQKELAVTKDTITKIDKESQQLYEKLKELEGKVAERRSQALVNKSYCNCNII